jgi:hypothetical protein
VNGIRLDVYPRQGVIHNFQAPSIVQEHHDKLGQGTNNWWWTLKFEFKIHDSWRSDYNRHTNLSFVYLLTSREYHELVENWDIKKIYNLSIPEWADASYPWKIYVLFITNLASCDLKMEIVQKNFIHNLYVSHTNIVHWRHIWHTDL